MDEFRADNGHIICGECDLCDGLDHCPSLEGSEWYAPFPVDE